MSDAEEKQRKYDEFERVIGPWMLGLSVLFVVVFIVGYLPNVPEQVRITCEALGWFIWFAFALEFGLRLLLAPDRAKMVRTHVFDLVVLLLPGLRVFRGLRGFRSLLRAMVAIGGITISGRALDKTRRIVRSRGVPYVLALVVLATAAGALIVYQLEADSVSTERNIVGIGDAIWWAVSTVTTVGYGDRFPTTTEGRVVAFTLMLLGLGLFSLVTARIAAFFLGDEETQDETRARVEALHERLDRMEGLLREANRSSAERVPQAKAD